MKRTMWKCVPFACAFICALSFTSSAYADELAGIENESVDVESHVVAPILESESVETTVEENEALEAPEEPQATKDSLSQDTAQEAVSPEDSDDVADSGEAEKPAEPVKPTEPVQPSQPVQPEKPSTPEEPEKPSTPSTPVEPEAPQYTQQFVKVGDKWHYFDKAGKDTGVVAVSAGWKQCEGVWYWFKNANTYAENEWVRVNGSWYYLADKGHMLTGNQVIEGKRYLLNPNGDMVKGVLWQKIRGTWYYINYGGSLTCDGWRFINQKWYYFDELGRMKTGWVKVEGKWYSLNSSGAMLTGWQKVNGSWYFMRSNGMMHEGWGFIGGKWYYLQPSSGHMRTNWIQLDGKWYLLSQSGHMLTGWQLNANKWYLLANNGVMQTGWHKVNGKWYFMNQGGSMKANTWYYDNGYKRWYYFESSGRMNESADTQLHDMVENIINTRTGRGSDALQRAFNYVVSYPYRNGSLYPTGDWGARYAKEMYRNGSGNCYRFAGLFCWIARGLGYRANTVSGWVPGAVVPQAPHGWVEVYVNGRTYVCDPDLAHEIPSRNWYMVTYANAPTYYHTW